MFWLVWLWLPAISTRIQASRWVWNLKMVWPWPHLVWLISLIHVLHCLNMLYAWPYIIVSLGASLWSRGRNSDHYICMVPSSPITLVCFCCARVLDELDCRVFCICYYFVFMLFVYLGWLRRRRTSLVWCNLHLLWFMKLRRIAVLGTSVEDSFSSCWCSYTVRLELL